MHTLLSTFTRIIDAIFPKKCFGCGVYGTLFCFDCISNTPRADRPSQPFITAIFDYHNKAIRNLIWKFKYRNARDVAKLFGGLLYDEIIDEIGNDLRVRSDENFLLIPIPLHKDRLRERGYNQSELLTREIIKCDSNKILKIAGDALIRSRKTLPQAKSQKRAHRFENLRGAFVANKEIAQGKHIILIDDVTTTGATLSEARKALLAARAKTVRAYTIAH